MNDYQIEKFPDDVFSLIECFFGDNHNYYMGKVKKIDISDAEHEVKSYYELVKTIVSKCDDRKYTIEIQTDEDIEILDNVIAVIFAQGALDVWD
ncbi:MAG: hypothetical protein GX022_07725 [Clostridiaceae bacterium]|nr:hypothetical protein [Clostridiaceae bacterium]